MSPDPVSASYRPLTSCGDVRESVRLDADLSTTAPVCLTVRTRGVTIEGAGHRVQAGQFAVLANHARVTVRNLISPAGVQIYGAGATGSRLENSQVGRVGVYMADDVTLIGNRMAMLAVQGLHEDPPLRTVVTGNTIGSKAERLVYLSPNGDGRVACVRSEIVFRENVVQSMPAPPARGAVLFYLRCGSHNSIVGNTFRSANATGILMRDEADANLLERNVVWVNTSVRAALHLISGNVDKHHPRDNVFRNNVFRGERARSVWIQSRKFAANTFTGNVFWGAAPEGARIAGGSRNVFDHNTFVNDAAGNSVVIEAFHAPGNTYTSNIFVHEGGAFFRLSGVTDFAGHHGDHNVFFSRTGPAVFHRGWSLAQWRSRSGADASSIEADPLFTNPGGGDFSLRAESRARGAGAGGSDAGAPR